MLQIILYHVSLTYTNIAWVTDGYSWIKYLLPNLAWFFWKGGMFYKDKPLSSVVSQGLSKLMLPYVSFLFLSISSLFVIEHDKVMGEGIVNYCSNIAKSLITDGTAGVNGVVWYLLVFFGIKFLYTYMRTKLRLSPLTIAGISFFIAFALWYIFINRNYTFWVGSIFCNMVFFSLGDSLRKKQYNKLFAVISFFVVVILPSLGFTYLSLSSNGGWQEYNISGYIFSYPLVIASILLVNNLVKFIPDSILSGSFITSIGRQSMGWFLLHHLILSWSVYILGLLGIEKTNPWAPLASIIAIFTLVPLLSLILNRYFPWALGNKKTKAVDRLP